MKKTNSDSKFTDVYEETILTGMQHHLILHLK